MSMQTVETKLKQSSKLKQNSAPAEFCWLSLRISA